jgi:hypothetical protein
MGSVYMAHLVSRRKLVAAVVVTAAAALAAVAIAAFRPSAHPGGDPGGRLMAKITLLVRVVPGFERGRIPWGASSCLECQSPAPYARKTEPRWDSCDGLAGTFGWNSVAIQVGFRWTGSRRGLVDLLNARLGALGWAKSGAVPRWAGDQGPGSHWISPPGPSPAEAFALDPPDQRHQWTAVIEAKPHGPLSHGC